MTAFTPVTVSEPEIFSKHSSHPLTHITDQPNETLETDARMISGRNPTIPKEAVSENNNPHIGKESPANK